MNSISNVRTPEELVYGLLNPTLVGTVATIMYSGMRVPIFFQLFFVIYINS